MEGTEVSRFLHVTAYGTCLGAWSAWAWRGQGGQGGRKMGEKAWVLVEEEGARGWRGWKGQRCWQKGVSIGCQCPALPTDPLAPSPPPPSPSLLPTTQSKSSQPNLPLPPIPHPPPLTSSMASVVNVMVASALWAKRFNHAACNSKEWEEAQ